jgi:hypothetical protein
MHSAAIKMARAIQTVCDPTEQEFLPAIADARFSEIAKRLQKTEDYAAPLGSAHVSAAPEPVRTPEDEQFKAASEDRIVEKLMQITAGKVAIRVKEGDTEAILFGEWLGLVFIKAGWIVTSFEARPLPPEDQNLTLAISGNFPFPKRASTIHSALAAAGLGLAFGIDPASDSPIPTIIVPRRPVEDKGQTEADARANPPTVAVDRETAENASKPGDS